MIGLEPLEIKYESYLSHIDSDMFGDLLEALNNVESSWEKTETDVVSHYMES